MKVLVTGSTGFIGRHLLDRLLSGGAREVYALVRDPRRLSGLLGAPGLRILEGDLFHIPEAPAGIDVVYHLAGLTKSTNIKDYYSVNAEGTASLVRRVVAAGLRPRFVLLSSLAAGGPSAAGRAVREDDPPHPVSPYGESKLRSEEEARKAAGALPVSILRVAAVYGPGDEDFLEYFRYIARGILPLMGGPPRPLSVCHVRDVVEAVEACVRPGAPAGTFNIADPTPRTWEEIGRTAGEALGKTPLPLRVPAPVFGAAAALSETVSRLTRRPTPLNRSKSRDARQPGWVADVRKARDLLGFEARVPFAEGIRETIGWYVRNGRL